MKIYVYVEKGNRACHLLRPFWHNRKHDSKILDDNEKHHVNQLANPTRLQAASDLARFSLHSECYNIYI